MMPMIGALIVLMLVGAWLFDRYVRKPRGLHGGIDYYAPDKSRGAHWTPMSDQHDAPGGFGG